uniref:Nuclear pore complex protein Nup85 n=1 Tax=Romanomermis culicivorax TaxID=13658 RepID=A0A915IYE2_ROMCU
KSGVVNVVTLNSGFENECYRRLANEFHSVFQKRQSLSNEYSHVLGSSTIGSADLQKLSAVYQMVIQTVSNNLNESEHDSHFEILNNARLIWGLVDALMLRSTDTLPSGDLAEWSSANLVFYNENGGDLWREILINLCTANIEQCIRNLEKLSNSRSDPFFSRFVEHVRNMPSIFDSDKLEWVKWQQVTIQLTNDSYLIADQQLNLAVRIISAQESAFKTVAEKYDLKFHHIMPGFVLFSNKFCKIYELLDFAKVPCLLAKSAYDYAARKLIPSKEKDLLIENIFFAIFELDVINILKLCSDYFNNWLFVAHLVDLLKSGGCEDLQNLVNLWQLAAEYFLSCPTYGKEALKLHIQRLSGCQSDHKILKLLALCQKCDFDDIAQIIIREKCVENLKYKSYNKALSWCLQSEEPSLVTLVAEEILDSCQNLSGDDTNLFDSGHVLHSLITFIETLAIEIETSKTLRRYCSNSDGVRSKESYFSDLIHDLRLNLSKCMVTCDFYD